VRPTLFRDLSAESLSVEVLDANESRNWRILRVDVKRDSASLTFARTLPNCQHMSSDSLAALGVVYESDDIGKMA
jgi:hypothetical protein